MKILACLLFMASFLDAQPIEFNVDLGDHWFYGLRDPQDPSAILPLGKLSFLNKDFAKQGAHVRVELNSDAKDIVMTTWIDGFEKYDIKERHVVSGYDRGYPFGADFLIGGVRLARKDDCLLITQMFSSRKTGRRYEFVAIVSKNRKHLIEQVKISKSFVFWTWDFNDPTESLSPFKKHFENPDPPAPEPTKN